MNLEKDDLLKAAGIVLSIGGTIVGAIAGAKKQEKQVDKSVNRYMDKLVSDHQSRKKKY